MTTIKNRFADRFTYDPAKALCVGTEREGLILDRKTKQVVSRSPQLLRQLVLSKHSPDFSPELSACQIETHTPPTDVTNVTALLRARQQVLAQAAERINLQVSYQPVAPANMPLDHYPKPYYDRIVSDLPLETLQAGCRVLGTHGHVGMPDHDTALRVYNKLVRQFNAIMAFADPSAERMELYQSMAKETWRPREYASWDVYADYAQAMGFYDEPRKCWSLLRISIHGTIEFRMFDSVDSVDTVAAWMQQCHTWCAEAM